VLDENTSGSSNIHNKDENFLMSRSNVTKEDK